MPLHHLPVALFLLLAAWVVGDLAWCWERLPEKVATHFGWDGRPNGWSSRQTLAVGTGFLMLLFGGLMLGAGRLASMPTQSINLPNKDHWLTPARAGETLAAIVAWSRWFLLSVFAFIAIIEVAAVHANLTTPPRLMLGVAPLLVCLAVLVVGLFGWLFWRFRMPKASV